MMQMFQMTIIVPRQQFYTSTLIQRKTEIKLNHKLTKHKTHVG